MKQYLVAGLLLFSALNVAQILPPNRSTNWSVAGLRVAPPVYADTLIFTGDNTGGTDVSTLLQTALSGLTQPTVIQFLPGTYLFNSSILVPSQVVLRGYGADATTFNFDLGGASSSCFEVSGSETRLPSWSLSALAVGDTDLSLTNSSIVSLAVGDYVRLLQDDSRLTGLIVPRTGQISRVSALTRNTITIEDAARLDYPAIYNPRFAHLNNPRTHVGFECFTVNRIDQVHSTTGINTVAKFSFSYATNCWIKGVRSVKCNGAHVRAEYSAHLHVSECYFNNAFGHGSGGQAYGVNLLNATSECRVENNVFENLRHSMLVHYGANANVFAYNYSFNTKDEFGLGSEDLVCHGNYPYLNLFEGNVANWGAVDNAAGKNGPYNTYFRNRLTSTQAALVWPFPIVNGFWISNSASNNQNVIANHTPGAPGQLNATGHQIEQNSWQIATGTVEASLAYAQKPEFLESNEFGVIGFPNFNVSNNPASDRVSSGNFFENSCGTNIYRNGNWSFGVPNAAQYKQFDLIIDTNENLVLNTNVAARSISLRPGAAVDFQSNPILTDSIYFEADTLNGYSQALGGPSAPVVYEQVITQPGWHMVASPVAGLTVADLNGDIILVYAGKGQHCNVYTWDGPTAQYKAVVNGSETLDQTALYLFVSHIYVKPGGGINKDGQLPVKVRFRGRANQGTVTGPTLGLGGSSHTTGSAAVGWNLIPNPYPSSLDLDAVFATLPANYQPGVHIWNPTTESYEARSTSLLAPGNPAAVAPGQAFFVKLDPGASTTSGFYDFTNADRSIRLSPVFRKSENYGAVLSLQSAKGAQNLYLHFNESGSFTKEPNDITRYFSGTGKIAQWSSIKFQAGKARYMAIGQYPMLSTGNEIPLFFNAPQDSIYLIVKESLNLPQGLQISLLNKETGQLQPLDNSPVAVKLKRGENTQRYALLFTGKEEVNNSQPFAEIYRVNNEIWVDYPQNKPGRAQLSLFDLQGRLLLKTEPFAQEGRQTFLMPASASGFYLIQYCANGNIDYQKIYLP